MFIVGYAVLALAAAEPVPAVSGPATAAEVKMALERAKQEIAQEEKSWAEETAREKEAEVRRRARYAEFSKDKLRLESSLAEQERKLSSLLAQMEGHQFKGRDLQARFRQLGQVVAEQAVKLRADMAKSLPYRLDKRLESVDLLIRDIEGGSVSPEEALNRIWGIHQNERRMAQDAEVYSGDFPQETGDPLQVKYLRVGMQMLAFSSLDGTKLGVLVPGDSSGRYRWAREKDMDYAARQAVKQAVATAEGKSVPGFVPLPVWKNSFVAASPVSAAAGKGKP